MDALSCMLQKVSKFLNIIGMIALSFMMALTVADVLMRAGGHPLVGKYEIDSDLFWH